MFTDCRSVRGRLGLYVDDELVGAEMLRVSEHLSECASCQFEVTGVRHLGASLRVAASTIESPTMAGLAGGVVSRVKAERSQSWRALFQRAVDDWHWAMIGLGSIAGSTTSAVIVASVLWFGPAPERGDSLSVMLSELSAKETNFVVQPAGQNWDQIAWRVAGGEGNANPRGGMPVAVSGFFVSDQDAVTALADALAPNPDGRILELSAMSERNRIYAERLLDDISRSRIAPARVLLMSSTTVSAKGL